MEEASHIAAFAHYVFIAYINDVVSIGEGAREGEAVSVERLDRAGKNIKVDKKIFKSNQLNESYYYTCKSYYDDSWETNL